MDVKAPGVGRGRDEGKAEDPHQRGVLDQELAQVGHVADVLVELDQVGGHVGRTGLGLGAGPGAVGIASGKVVPVEWAEEVEVLAGHCALTDETG